MAYVHGTVSVGSTATQILTSPTNEAGGILIRNNGPVSVYLGGSSVTADVSGTGGLLVSPGEAVTVSTTASVAAALYAITSAGSADVSYLYV